jgi:glycosyltransferase involved in cell wall biosynthesis
MKSSLRFSAIIIFSNQRDFVRNAMDSALSQTADGLEVIAVDDGSTDGTREVLNEYRDRARLVFLDQNLGASAARNAGTEVATGDYVAYLDGDDAFLPWAIDTYRKVAEEETPVLMMGPVRCFEGALPEPGTIPQRVRYVHYDDYFAKERVVFISASAMVVHRRSLESVGGWEGFPMEDLDLLYRLGTASPFVQITEPSTTLHRSHAGQTVRQTQRILKGAEWLIANDKRGRYPGGDSRRFERRACIGGIGFLWAREHARRGFPGTAFRFVVSHAPYVGAAVVRRAQRTMVGRRPQTEALLST